MTVASHLPKDAIFLALAIVLLSIMAQPAKAQSFVTDDGDQFQVTLKLDKETILLSEATYMSFQFQSFSSRDLCVGIGGDYRNNIGRPDRFSVSVVGDGAKTVPQPKVTIHLGGIAGCGIIPAGGTYAIRLFLPHWATFKEAGSYTINVTRRLMVSAYIEGSPKSTLHADVSAKIKVAADDSAQVGALIESLGASMLEKNNKNKVEAAAMLGYLDDQRTIQYFATALRQYGAEPEWSYEHRIVSIAVSALSRVEDDRAINALESMISSTVESTRSDIAHALYATNHPRGVDLLLTMKNDSDWFVRLRVAQRLAKVDSGESVSILRAMLQDENEDVRKAARDSLKTLRKN